MTKKLWISCGCLALTLVLAAGVLFAWFSDGSSTLDNLVINTANIKISTKLFQVQDFNSDGICDTEIVNGEEEYLFVTDELGERIDFAQRDNIPFREMFPGKTLTFLMQVTNSGNERSSLNVTAEIDLTATTPASGSLVAMNELYTLRYEDAAAFPNACHIRLTNAENKLDFGENPYLVEPGATVDFLFAIRFEDLAFLREQDPTHFGSLTDLSGYQTDSVSGRAPRCVFTLFAELQQAS